MLDKRLVYPWCHKKVKSGYRLTSVLLILIGLKYDRRQSGIALNTLRGTDAPILGVKTTLIQILQVILHICGGLGGIIVKVMDMDISPTMSCSAYSGESR